MITNNVKVILQINVIFSTNDAETNEYLYAKKELRSIYNIMLYTKSNSKL